MFDVFCWHNSAPSPRGFYTTNITAGKTPPGVRQRMRRATVRRTSGPLREPLAQLSVAEDFDQPLAELDGVPIRAPHDRNPRAAIASAAGRVWSCAAMRTSHECMSRVISAEVSPTWNSCTESSGSSRDGTQGETRMRSNF